MKVDEHTKIKIDNLRQIVQNDLKDWRSRLRLAVLLEKQGMRDEVQALCRQILEQQPNNSFAKARIGRSQDLSSLYQDVFGQQYTPPPKPSRVKNKNRLLRWAALALGLMLAIAAVYLLRPKPKQNLTTYSISRITNGGGYAPSWSPDGQRLIYLSQGAVWSVSLSPPGNPTVLFQLFDSVQTDFLQYHSTLSPDGRYLGIGNDCQTVVYDLWTKVPLFTTPELPRAIYQNNLVLYDAARGGLVRTDGAEKYTATSSWVSWHPRGAALAFTSQRGLMVRDEAGGLKQLRQCAIDQFPVFSTDGKSIYLASDVSNQSPLQKEPFPAAQPGLLRLDMDSSSIVRIRPLTRNSLQHITGIACSGDGRQIVYTAREGGTVGLWVIGSDGSDCRQLAVPPGCYIKSYPAWSPRGDRIALACEQNGRVEIYILNLSPETKQ